VDCAAGSPKPSVKLSPHSAPIRQTHRSFRSSSEQREPRVPFIAHTEPSAPVALHRYARLAVFGRLYFSLSIRATGSCSSARPCGRYWRRLATFGLLRRLLGPNRAPSLRGVSRQALETRGMNWSARHSLEAAGRENENVAPGPSLGVARMRPWWTLDNGATYGQPDPHSVALGGVECIEELVRSLRIKTYPASCTCRRTRLPPLVQF